MSKTIHFYRRDFIEETPRPPSLLAPAGEPRPVYSVTAESVGGALTILRDLGHSLRNLDLQRPRDAKFEDWRELDGFNLRGVDLSGCDLSRLSLGSRDITGLTAVRVRMHETGMGRCWGSNARFDGSEMEKVPFVGSKLENPSFRRARMTAVNFDMAEWRKTSDRTTEQLPDVLDNVAAMTHIADPFMGAMMLACSCNESKIPHEYKTLRAATETTSAVAWVAKHAVKRGLSAVAGLTFAYPLLKHATTSLTPLTRIYEIMEKVETGRLGQAAHAVAGNSMATGIAGVLLVGVALYVGDRVTEKVRKQFGDRVRESGSSVSTALMSWVSDKLQSDAFARLNYLVFTKNRQTLKTIADAVDGVVAKTRGELPHLSPASIKGLGHVLLCNRNNLDMALDELSLRKGGLTNLGQGRILTIVRTENAGTERPVSMTWESDGACTAVWTDSGETVSRAVFYNSNSASTVVNDSDRIWSEAAFGRAPTRDEAISSMCGSIETQRKEQSDRSVGDWVTQNLKLNYEPATHELIRRGDFAFVRNRETGKVDNGLDWAVARVDRATRRTDYLQYLDGSKGLTAAFDQPYAGEADEEMARPSVAERAREKDWLYGSREATA